MNLPVGTSRSRLAETTGDKGTGAQSNMMKKEDGVN